MMSETKYVIYTITNLVNGKQYVGQSKNHVKRWKSHLQSFEHYAKHGKAANRYLAASFNKYGRENFKFEVVCSCYGIENANILEVDFISELGTFKPDGYNLTTGGGGTTGVKWQKEYLKAFKSKMKGEGNYFYGRQHSEETKNAIRQARSIPIKLLGTEYSSILDASHKLNVPRDRIYRFLRDGKAGYTSKESSYTLTKSRPNRRFKANWQQVKDHHIVAAILKIYNNCITDDVISLSHLHFECVRKGIRTLRGLGCITTETIRHPYKRGRSNLIKVVETELDRFFEDHAEVMDQVYSVVLHDYERYSE